MLSDESEGISIPPGGFNSGAGGLPSTARSALNPLGKIHCVFLAIYLFCGMGRFPGRIDGRV